MNRPELHVRARAHNNDAIRASKKPAFSFRLYQYADDRSRPWWIVPSEPSKHDGYVLSNSREIYIDRVGEWFMN